jgi:apolipoprotein N-acyltransferase
MTPQGDAALAHARARQIVARRWWDRPPAAIVLASLAPASVAFYAHQHIAFGSLLGEYYLMGLGAWLATACNYAFTSALYLTLWWGCFRLAVEAAAWLGAHAASSSAAAVRRFTLRTAALIYYASIPAMLVLRFLA